MSIYPEPSNHELVEYAGERVDDVPQHICSISRSMLPFLHYGLDILKEPEIWKHDPTYGDLAIQAINELAAQLQVSVGFPVGGGDMGVYFGPGDLKYPGQLDTLTVSSVYINCATVYSATPNSDQLLLSFPMRIVPGKYRLTYVVVLGNYMAQTRVSFVGPATLYTAYDDLYSAGLVYNHVQRIEIDIPVAGDYVVSWKTYGKNVLSTNYFVLCSSFALRCIQLF